MPYFVATGTLTNHSYISLSPSTLATIKTEFVSTCRHPSKNDRPTFRDVVLALTDRKDDVLSIPDDKNRCTNVLGNSLEEGEGLYKDLQERYLPCT